MSACLIQHETEADRLNRFLETKNEDDFNWLYQRFNGRLFIHVDAWVRNDPIADDLLNEFWAELWLLPPAEKDIRSPIAWFRRCLWFKARDYFVSERSGLNREMLSLDTILEDDPNFDVRDRDLERCEQMEAQWDELVPLLAVLPDNERQAVEMYYGQGQTREQLAESLGVPVSTAYNWAWRGLKKLRKQLGGDA